MCISYFVLKVWSIYYVLGAKNIMEINRDTIFAQGAIC